MRGVACAAKVVLVATAFAVACCLTVVAEPEPAVEVVEEIEQAIAAAGASWSAGVTWVSRLSPDERQSLCGDLGEAVPDELKTTLPAPDGALRASS